ncbi:hypothetical protein ACWCPF_41930 [Streptomyces sp. NPDC001858]
MLTSHPRCAIRWQGGGAWRWSTATTLVRLTARRLESGDEVRGESGAIGHGPSADELTEYLCDELRSWAPERIRHTPSLIVHSAWEPVLELGGHLELTALTGIHRPRRVSPAVRRPCAAIATPRRTSSGRLGAGS